MSILAQAFPVTQRNPPSQALEVTNAHTDPTLPTPNMLGAARCRGLLTWDTFRICSVKLLIPVTFLSSQLTLGAFTLSAVPLGSSPAGSTVSSTTASPGGAGGAAGPLPAPHSSPPAAASQAAAARPSFASPGTAESTTGGWPGGPLPSIASAISAVRYRTASPLIGAELPAPVSVTTPAPGGRDQPRSRRRLRTHLPFPPSPTPASPSGRARPSPARSSSSHHIPTTALRLPGQRPLPPELLRRFRFRCRACIRWERRAARRHLRVLRRGVTRFGRSVCARCGTGRGRLRVCCWSSDTTAGHWEMNPLKITTEPSHCRV